MIYPNFLTENNTIGVPAPSSGITPKIEKNKLLNAKKRLENLNYNIILSNNIYKNKKGRSSSTKERAKEINNMFKNKNINLILCATGGEFLIEILPYIDFSLIQKNPKYIAGFSDPTGLLYPITTKYDIATIYGQNLKSLGSQILHQSQQNFLEIIKGNLITQHNFKLYEEEPLPKITGLENYNLTKKVYWHTIDNKQVSLKGRIIGGCLDIISELSGTKYDGIQEFNKKYQNDGIIWYFDNCELSMEETIRTLWKLNELNYFKYTKCVIFGRFGTNKTYLKYDTKTCLKDSILSELNIPIIYDADISHKPPCLTIINGSIANINISKGKSTISFTLE